MSEKKKHFYKTLNNIVATNMVDNEEAYIINDYIGGLEMQLQQKENIIKEVREYITSYESIETIQQFDHNKNNKDLDCSTIDEITRRYMIVHDKVLEILDKGDKGE